jgi:hypothetical protein
MSQFVYQFPFYLGGPIVSVDENGCWIGLASEFESRLLEPFDTYALEQLRQRFLFTLTTTHAPKVSARVLLQMAFETEISTILVKIITPPADLFTYKICERRRYIDVDQDMHLQKYLIQPGFDDLLQMPNLPGSFTDFLARYMISDYPRYRMSALAGVICVAKVLQQ